MLDGIGNSSSAGRVTDNHTLTQTPASASPIPQSVVDKIYPGATMSSMQGATVDSGMRMMAHRFADKVSNFINSGFEYNHSSISMAFVRESLDKFPLPEVSAGFGERLKGRFEFLEKSAKAMESISASGADPASKRAAVAGLSRQYARELVSLKAKAAKEGRPQKMVINGGTFAHAMLTELIVKPDGKLDVRIFNTGDRVYENHADSVQKDGSVCTVKGWENIDFDRVISGQGGSVSSKFLENMVASATLPPGELAEGDGSIDQLYHWAGGLGGDSVTYTAPQRLLKPHAAGICTMRVLQDYIQHSIIDEAEGPHAEMTLSDAMKGNEVRKMKVNASALMTTARDSGSLGRQLRSSGGGPVRNLFLLSADSLSKDFLEMRDDLPPSEQKYFEALLQDLYDQCSAEHSEGAMAERSTSISRSFEVAEGVRFVGFDRDIGQGRFSFLGHEINMSIQDLFRFTELFSEEGDVEEEEKSEKEIRSGGGGGKSFEEVRGGVLRERAHISEGLSTEKASKRVLSGRSSSQTAKSLREQQKESLMAQLKREVIEGEIAKGNLDEKRRGN